MKKYIYKQKNILTTKTNRKQRKKMARAFKTYFDMDKIPNARYDAIKQQIDRAAYEYEYEKYAGW